MREDALGERARNAISRRRTARMDDSAPTVAALESEAVVEVDAELDEVANPRGSLVGQNRDSARPAEPASGSHRVLRVE